MIAQSVQNDLNRLMNEEYTSWYFYRSAAAYCEGSDLKGFGKWLRDRSQKKLGRAAKVFDFLLERRARVELKPIEAPNGGWDSPRAVLDRARRQEDHLAECVEEMADSALSQGDHATNNFLEDFVSDQAEAQAKAEAVVHRFTLVDDAPNGLFLFDQSLA